MIYKDRMTKIFVDPERDKKDYRLKIIYHELVGKDCFFNGKKSTITHVYRDWKWGFYYLVDLIDDSSGETYSDVFLRNRSSCDPDILKLVSNIEF